MSSNGAPGNDITSEKEWDRSPRTRELPMRIGFISATAFKSVEGDANASVK